MPTDTEKTSPTSRSTGFSAELWESITPTYDAIASHPFLLSVADGTLSPERFIYFIDQDRLYLRAYSRDKARPQASPPSPLPAEPTLEPAPAPTPEPSQDPAPDPA